MAIKTMPPDNHKRPVQSDASNAETLDRCANCDRLIGRLETAHVWRNHTVCTACIQTLQKTGKLTLESTHIWRWIAIAAVALFAVAMAIAAVQNYETSMQQRADAFLYRISLVETSLAMSGQQASAPEIRKRIDDLEMVGDQPVNPKNAVEIFSAISRAVGNRASPEDKFAALRAALLGWAGGMDPTSDIALGTNFAELAAYRCSGGAFDGYTDEKLGDLADEATIKIGGAFSERQLGFLARSKDKLSAMKMIYGATFSHQGIDVLEEIERVASR